MIRISQRLYVRVAIAIAMVAILVSLITSSVSYYFGLEQKQQTNYRLLEQLAETVEKTAATAAYVNDSELAQEIVQGLLVNDLVIAAKLSNDVGLEIVAGTANNTKEKVSIGLAHPFLADIQVGLLEIYPDYDFIEGQVKDATKKEVFLLLLHSIIIAFFVSLFVHKRLTQPLQNLSDNFEKIDPSSPKTMRMIDPQPGRKNEINKVVLGINAIIHKLHQTIQLERDLRIETQILEEKFRLIFEQASAGICLIDEHDNLAAFNPAFASYFTPTGQTELGTTHFPELLSNAEQLKQLLREIRNKKKVGQVALDLECKVGNQRKWMHCLFAKVTDQRAMQRDIPGSIIEVIAYDITDRAERELQTRFEADHDSLTHLLNRRSGEKRLHKTLYSSLKKGQHLVLMMIDLDKFKPVNDKYGHESGDKVLIEIANRINQQFQADTDTAIRWGGDEFVIAFMASTDDLDTHILEKAEGLLQAIKQPIKIQPELACEVSASIGVVIAPQHGRVLHELLVNADNTMYQVKDDGRGRIELYKPSGTTLSL